MNNATKAGILIRQKILSLRTTYARWHSHAQHAGLDWKEKETHESSTTISAGLCASLYEMWLCVVIPVWKNVVFNRLKLVLSYEQRKFPDLTRYVDLVILNIIKILRNNILLRLGFGMLYKGGGSYTRYTSFQIQSVLMNIQFCCKLFVFTYMYYSNN